MRVRNLLPLVVGLFGVVLFGGSDCVEVGSRDTGVADGGGSDGPARDVAVRDLRDSFDADGVDTGRGRDSGPAMQGPVELIVTNQRTGPIYVNWTIYERGTIFCEQQQGAGWEGCFFTMPGCSVECDVPPGHCCYDCDAPVPAVRRLDPGDSFTLRWTGEDWLHHVNYCTDGCDCYEVVAPESGHYRAGVRIYDSLTCDTEPCEDPDDDGVFDYAYPGGAPTTVYSEFDVPYASGEVHIVIN